MTVTVEEEMILEVRVHTVAIIIAKKRLQDHAVVKKELAAAVNHHQSQEHLITNRKAEAPCPGATGIRRADEKVVL